MNIDFVKKYTWRVDFESDNNNPFNLFLADTFDIQCPEYVATGTLIYQDNTKTVFCAEQCSPLLINFIIWGAELKHRTGSNISDIILDNNKYICIDNNTLSSLYFFDATNGEIVDAIYDEDGEFLDYDISEYTFEDRGIIPTVPIETVEKIRMELSKEDIEYLVEAEAIVESEDWIEEMEDISDDSSFQRTEAACKIGRVETWFTMLDCAILTAWRKNQPRRVKNLNNKKLQTTLRDLGYGVTKLLGCYQEAGSDSPSKENSFLVFDLLNKPDLFYQNIYHLAELYEQDSFLYKKKGKYEPAFIIGTNDAFGKETKKYAGRMQIGNMSAKEYSQIRSSRLSFE